ncbi:mitochondral 37S ribosomal protein S27 [Leucoagaricus gongylophorus]
MSLSSSLPWVRSPTSLRLLSLLETRSQIFQTAFNPTSFRTAAKYLRRRVRGPSMLAYYPPKLNIARVASMYPDLELVDEDEQTRLEDIEYRRKRGKGPPKKLKKSMLFLLPIETMAHS